METTDATHHHPVWHCVLEDPLILVDEVSVLTRVHEHACTQEAKVLRQSGVPAVG